MFLDVTDNFLRDVNMDPDTWKDTCVTYLIFQPDELLEERVSVKLANFAVNIADHLGELRKDPALAEMLNDCGMHSPVRMYA